jgi:hypothetical protein
MSRLNANGFDNHLFKFRIQITFKIDKIALNQFEHERCLIRFAQTNHNYLILSLFNRTLNAKGLQ